MACRGSFCEWQGAAPIRELTVRGIRKKQKPEAGQCCAGTLRLTVSSVRHLTDGAAREQVGLSNDTSPLISIGFNVRDIDRLLTQGLNETSADRHKSLIKRMEGL